MTEMKEDRRQKKQVKRKGKCKKYQQSNLPTNQLDFGLKNFNLGLGKNG